ncbi:MAG: hypothetical protein JW993_03065 [Sedimentisphaerales bacterium]|nr:hypothetical protein [Sedimentisphaerales bacterium]
MTRHVLKHSEVEFAGSFQLNAGTNGANPPVGPHLAAQPVRVRIAETHPEFALLEVVCSCGRVTLVRCEYATDASLVPAGSGQD